MKNAATSDRPPTSDKIRGSDRDRSTVSHNSIDSQSVRTTGVCGVRGYDKRVNGRKRHILVDTGGLVLRTKVHTADLRDRAAVPLLLNGADEQFPKLEHLWVDQGTRSSFISLGVGRSFDILRAYVVNGSTWRSAELADCVVQLRTSAARAEGARRPRAIDSTTSAVGLAMYWPCNHKYAKPRSR
jgi:Transposase DDE domain